MTTYAPQPFVQVVGPAPGAGELFQILRDGRSRTRAELAEITQLARSTITARLDALLETGLIAPVTGTTSTGGRPAACFAMSSSARIVLAVDLGASHVSLAVTDLAGAVLAEHNDRLDIASGPEIVLDKVAELGAELIAETGRSVAELAGVGIGLPGPVEHATGKPANPPIMPGWDGYDVPAHLSRTFATAILVDNDVNLMALGEAAVNWPDDDHLLFVKVATGIGAGIIADRRLDRGSMGTAGDLGHVRLPSGPGVLCRCGNIDCLEAVAASPAIAAKLREQGFEASGAVDIIDAIRRGEIAAVQAVRQAGREIGEILATCVNLLNPSVIVVGGELADAGEFLLAGVREVVYTRSPPLATTNLRVAKSISGARAGILGASVMVRDAALSAEAVDAYIAAHRAPA